MNAIDLLLREHTKIRRLFAFVADRRNTDVERGKTFRRLLHVLDVHESMEQTEFYPYLPNPPAILKHLLQEESDAATAIKSIKRVILFGDAWNRRFDKLRHDVLHHAGEEETKLFPVIRRNVSAVELRRRAAIMQRYLSAHNG